MPTKPNLCLTLPANLQHLAEMDTPITEFFTSLESIRLSEAQIYDIRLAIQELCVNIINHAYAGASGEIELEIALRSQPLAVVITSRDRGTHQFDIHEWTPPNLDELQVHGYGFFLMQQLMDQVDYQRQGDENQWRLIKWIETQGERDEDCN